MKKALAFVLSFVCIGIIAASAEAKAGSTAIAPATLFEPAAFGPQRRRQRQARRGRQNRPVRTVTRTRVVRYGRQVYRETYQIRYLPNGRTQTRLISRVRIR